MTIISAQLIDKPRRSRACDHCGEPICGRTLRIYGAADVGDKPYALYLHPGCTEVKHPKIVKALAGRAASTPTTGPVYGRRGQAVGR